MKASPPTLALGSAFLLILLPVPAAAQVCAGNPPPNDGCEVTTCVAGEWVTAPRPDGTACDPGDPCAVARCNSGSCVLTSRATCRAEGPCETATCDMGACTITKVASGTACPASTNPCEAVCDGLSPHCQPR